jgi:integrase
LLHHPAARFEILRLVAGATDFVRIAVCQLARRGREGMKRGYFHLTPLPRQAVAMLRELQNVTGNFDYVFVGRNDPGKPLSDAAA